MGVPQAEREQHAYTPGLSKLAHALQANLSNPPNSRNLSNFPTRNSAERQTRIRRLSNFQTFELSIWHAVQTLKVSNFPKKLTRKLSTVETLGLWNSRPQRRAASRDRQSSIFEHRSYSVTANVSRLSWRRLVELEALKA